MGHAIASSTRAGYEAAARRYRGHAARAGRSGAFADMTPAAVANWLADEAADGRGLTRDSLNALRTGVSTLWREECLPGENPTAADVVDRLVTGYGKLNAPAEAAARRTRRANATIALTVELLGELSGAAGADRPSGMMPVDQLYWAAACVATFSLSRCAELFGATRIGRPPVPASAVTFFDDARELTVRAVRPDDAAALLRVPHHFCLELGPTKADPLATNRPVPIAAGVAVQALWAWMHTRQRIGGVPQEPLFGMPGTAPLARAHLLERVACWVQATHGGDKPKVTAKAFRRGGNQTLLASGAALPDIMGVGRWRSATMPAVYGSESAAAARAMLTSQEMGRIYAVAKAARR